MDTLFTSVPIEILGVFCLIGGFFLLIKESKNIRHDSWTRSGMSVVIILAGILGLTYHSYPIIADLLIIIIPIMFIALFVGAIVFKIKAVRNISLDKSERDRMKNDLIGGLVSSVILLIFFLIILIFR